MPHRGPLARALPGSPAATAALLTTALLFVVVVPVLNAGVREASPLHLPDYIIPLIGKYLCYAMLALALRTLERLIYPVGFYRTKARVIRGICRDLIEKFGGAVPDTIDDLLELKGVGRKTANLVVTEAFGKPGICVDTHVHRISNRWGLVETKTPEKTETALREVLPRRHWIGYNALLVAFGQTICQPTSPWCSRCPIAGACPRIGVVHSR